MPTPDAIPPDIEFIQRLAAGWFKVPVEEIRTRRRDTQTALARNVAQYLTCTMTEHRIGAIARAFNCHHSGIIYARDRIKEWMTLRPDNFRAVAKMSECIAATKPKDPAAPEPESVQHVRALLELFEGSSGTGSSYWQEFPAYNAARAFVDKLPA